MVEKNHRDLMRSIHSYIEAMKKSTERNFAPSDFFIPSTYKDSTGRTLPCYLLTKKGCDMVANKMTGEKGITKRYTPTSSGRQEMNFIPEGDIYRLAAKSEPPVRTSLRAGFLMKSFPPSASMEDISPTRRA